MLTEWSEGLRILAVLYVALAKSKSQVLRRPDKMSWHVEDSEC